MNANFNVKLMLVHGELLVVHDDVLLVIHDDVLLAIRVPIPIQLLVLLVINHLHVCFHLIKDVYHLKHLFLSCFIITHTIVQVLLIGNLKIHVLTLPIDDCSKHFHLICLYSIFNFYSF